MKKYLRKSVKLLIALGVSIVFILGFNNKNSTAASNTDIRPGYDGQWYYYNDGNIDMSYTGLASSKEKGYTLHTCTVCGDTYKDNYTEDYDPHRKVYGDEYDARAIYVEPGDRVVFDLSREYKGYSVGSEYGYKELEAGQEIEITKDYEYKNLQFQASTGSYDSYIL